MLPQEEPTELPQPATFAHQRPSRIAGEPVPRDQTLMHRLSDLCQYARLDVAQCFELFGEFSLL
jgi:hypothetical protein